jgi:hypothetical protein
MQLCGAYIKSDNGIFRQIHQLENDIKTLENNMGFFSASKKANSLLEGIQKSLNASKERLSLLKIKLNELDKII